PSIGLSSNGVCRTTVPTFDVAGHSAGPGNPTRNCASVHACNPSAADGFNAIPSGNVTTAFFKSASPRPSGLLFCGNLTCTATPVGLLAAVAVGATSMLGVNGTRSQPVKREPVKPAAAITSSFS